MTENANANVIEQNGANAGSGVSVSDLISVIGQQEVEKRFLQMQVAQLSQQNEIFSTQLTGVSEKLEALEAQAKDVSEPQKEE